MDVAVHRRSVRLDIGDVEDMPVGCSAWLGRHNPI